MKTGAERGVRTAALAIMLAGALAACSKKERPVVSTPPPATSEPAEPDGPTAQPGLSNNKRLARIVDLLSTGEEATARVELAALLAEDPKRREALVLQQSIEGDPRAILPSDSFAYVVRPGETFITIARDYLRDSYKFYALARVNGIAGSALKAGDTIQVPGRYREPRPPREERPRATPRPRAADDTPATAPPAVATPRVNPAAAQRLRRAGLEAMSAGRIDQAVTRLERAASLDPGNAAIAADLARARRIQGAVRQRN